jgi:tetratricopeptide (TPR) repeat protein
MRPCPGWDALLVKRAARADSWIACAEHAPGGSGLERGPYVLQARFAAHVMRAEAALRAGDAAVARSRVKDVQLVMEQMKPWTGPTPSAGALARVAEIEARAEAIVAGTPQARDEAIKAIRKVADLQARAAPVGPAFFLTGSERLGQALLAAGRAGEALAEFERVIEQRPNRAMSLLGAAQAARASGDANKAQLYYAQLAKLWKDADPQLPQLAEVRAGAESSALLGAR